VRTIYSQQRGADVVLKDGSTIRLRPVREGDEELHLAEKTFKNYVPSILSKLKVPAGGGCGVPRSRLHDFSGCELVIALVAHPV
jgi:hypothetical protein